MVMTQCMRGRCVGCVRLRVAVGRAVRAWRAERARQAWRAGLATRATRPGGAGQATRAEQGRRTSLAASEAARAGVAVRGGQMRVKADTACGRATRVRGACGLHVRRHPLLGACLSTR